MPRGLGIFLFCIFFLTPSKFSVTLTSQLKSPIEREVTKNDPKRTEQQKRTESTINPIKREATRYREPLIAFGFRPMLAGVSSTNLSYDA